MDTSDQELTSASAEGDVDAFAALVRRHQRAVASTAFSITLRAELAEDITQETFLIAWRSLPSLRDRSRFASWVTGIARNQSKKYLRAQRPESSLDALSLEATGTDPHDVLISKEERSVLTKALSQLSEDHREVLCLFYWDDASTREVAQALGISEAAAQKRISRARSGLTREAENHLARAATPTRTAAALTAAILTSLGVASDAAAAAGATSVTTPTSFLPQLSLMAKVVVAMAVSCGALAIGFTVWGSSAPRPAPALNEQTTTALQDAIPQMRWRPKLFAALSKPLRPGHYTPPKSYELTRVKPNDVWVDLSGGHSHLISTRDLVGEHPIRRVSGYVRSPAGKPAAGAIVLASNDFGICRGLRLIGYYYCPLAINAMHGTVTNESGFFELELQHPLAQQLMAVHPAGWSLPIRVPGSVEYTWLEGQAFQYRDSGLPIPTRSPGRDASVNLTIDSLGTVHGQVTQKGEGIRATIEFKHRGGKLEIEIVTDQLGHYSMPLIPAGDYEVVVAEAVGMNGGEPNEVTLELSVEPGGETVLDTEIPDGALLVAEPTVTGLDTARLEYVLIPGNHEIETPGATPMALYIRFEDKGARVSPMGFGDRFAPMQFHGLSNGPYTLCVEARDPDKLYELFDFECRTVEIESPGTQVEKFTLTNPGRVKLSIQGALSKTD